MTKHPVVFITLLTALAFIAGCPPAKPKPVKPPKAEQPNAESSNAEPNEVEPTKAEPNEVEPTKTEPNEVEPTKTEPNEVEPTKTEPPKTKPPKPKPPKPKPPTKVAFHNKCAPILKAFVNDKGKVDYRKLKLKRLELNQLLNEFANLDSNEYNSWPKEDKIAFWINAYNIKLLKIMIDNYPIKASRIRLLFWPPTSIRHLGNIWKEYKFIVMDEEFTLFEVEQRFFRKQFDEPRVFFAISGACLSSPPLRNEPYYGHKLYKQLDDQTKKFLAGPRAFKIDRGKKTVYLSTILQPTTWYGKEFISKYGTDKKFKDQRPATRAVLNFLTNYIPRRDVSFLEIKNYSVKYIKYDWRLNDSSRK
ncbi:MAG: DUF547 domain-containing protein [Planctomycetota bacterium]|jgi:hypothetical protein